MESWSERREGLRNCLKLCRILLSLYTGAPSKFRFRFRVPGGSGLPPDSGGKSGAVGRGDGRRDPLTVQPDRSVTHESCNQRRIKAKVFRICWSVQLWRFLYESMGESNSEQQLVRVTPNVLLHMVYDTMRAQLQGSSPPTGPLLNSHVLGRPRRQHRMK